PQCPLATTTLYSRLHSTTLAPSLDNSRPLSRLDSTTTPTSYHRATTLPSASPLTTTASARYHHPSTRPPPFYSTTTPLLDHSRPHSTTPTTLATRPLSLLNTTTLDHPDHTRDS
ncbi:hypothetical protein EGW08_022547, partial [Elysia chlorotica]